MKRFILFGFLAAILLQAGVSDLHGQGRLLRKLQEEAEKKAIEEIFGKEKEEENRRAEEAEGSSSARNRRGSGISQQVPDVNLHITEARESYSASRYSAAKSALRQALWGVELEMGQQLLASLPETVSGLGVQQDEDRVSSTGIGFVGLVIERVYAGSGDMELRLSVGNDSGLFGLARIAAAGGMYTNSTDQANQKQIRFQEHNAYIQYDDYDGYMLSVPFGQSSIFLLQGVNFDTEDAFMAAASQFNLQTIKQKLGDQ